MLPSAAELLESAGAYSSFLTRVTCFLALSRKRGSTIAILSHIRRSCVTPVFNKLSYADRYCFLGNLHLLYLAIK